MAMGSPSAPARSPGARRGRTSFCLRAPLSWETMGGERHDDALHQQDDRQPEAGRHRHGGRSTALTCPAITVSTKFMAIWATWATVWGWLDERAASPRTNNVALTPPSGSDKEKERAREMGFCLLVLRRHNAGVSF